MAKTKAKSKSAVKKAIKKVVKKITSRKESAKKKPAPKKGGGKKPPAKKQVAKKAPPKKAVKKTVEKKTVKKPAKEVKRETTQKRETKKIEIKVPVSKTEVKRVIVDNTTINKPRAPKGPPKKSELKDPAPVIVPVVRDRPVNKPSKLSGVILPPDYDPQKDKGEFMNPVMLAYFKQLLIKWRTDLIRESENTIKETLQETELQQPDLADRASAETDHALELRTRDRERKLISKINQAIERIEEGEYGYCEETGEPISIARLIARPNATLSLEAQERHERMEKTQRDD